MGGVKREAYSFAREHAEEAERLSALIEELEADFARTPMQELTLQSARQMVARHVALANMWAAVEQARWAEQR